MERRKYEKRKILPENRLASTRIRHIRMPVGKGTR